MEREVGLARMDKSKSGSYRRGYTQQAMTVLLLFLLPLTPLSSIQAQVSHQDEKSVESKEGQSQPTKSGQSKKYEEVIHSGVKSILGLFTVHRIDDKVYYEIPPSVLNRDMLW